MSNAVSYPSSVAWVDGHERALLEGQIRPIVQELAKKEPAAAKVLPRRR